MLLTIILWPHLDTGTVLKVSYSSVIRKKQKQQRQKIIPNPTHQQHYFMISCGGAYNMNVGNVNWLKKKLTKG